MISNLLLAIMTLFNFSDKQQVQQWHTENDVVMGGVSSSEVTYVSEKDGHEGLARFSGHVSLENNGGFAQILHDRKTFDLSKFQGIALHVRGDGHTYQLRLETDAKRVAYAQSFTAKDEWQRIQLDFTDFKATFRGEDVPDAPDLNRASIRTVGVLIGNGEETDFELLIDAVEAY
jgi:monofunctional biosynthetic peptidoglycan transglycosylase